MIAGTTAKGQYIFAQKNQAHSLPRIFYTG
jgi:hypothetical protein